MSDTITKKLGKKFFGDKQNKYDYWVVEAKLMSGVISKGKNIGKPWNNLIVKVGKPNEWQGKEYVDCAVTSFDLKSEARKAANAFAGELFRNLDGIVADTYRPGWDVIEGNPAADAVAEATPKATFGTTFEDDDIPF